MTFFYNLNKKLDEIRATPSTTHGQLNERANSKSVDEGLGDMMATAGAKLKGLKANITKNPADRQSAVDAHRGIMKKELSKVKPGDRPELGGPSERYRNAQHSMATHKIDLDNNMEEGMGDMARKVGGMAKKVAGKALDTLGHGSDADMMRDLQRKMGVPQTGMKPGAEPNPKQVKEKMNPAKAKSFAALAEPKDKITFADKIAGAKKEVDEMLGDVAAEAMKKALGGGKGRNAEMDEASQDNAFTAHKRPRVDQPAKGSVEHGRKHDIKHDTTDPKYSGRIVTRRVDPSGISVGADDEAAQSGEKRGRGRPKKAGGPAQERVTANSRKADRTRFQSKKVKEAVGSDDIEVIERLMDAAFAEGNNALGNALQTALERIQGDQDEDQYGDEQVSEKAVSKKQQKFMGMVHATQKGEKPASKEVAKVAKEMPKKAAKDFAATKHKGLPEKAKSDDAPKKKKEKTEEAGGTGTPTASSGFSYGKGIYDSFNRDLENMIKENTQDLRESMSVNMSMNNDDMHGGPTKSLTVTATDEDAVTLSQLLKSAGLGGGDTGSSCGCGQPGCGCAQQEMDEAYGDTNATPNSPDYPTNTETSNDAMQYSGGLNKPKSTGQTTVPVIASQGDRQESYAEEEEDAIKRMMEMAGVKKKAVDEEKTEEGNKFTGNLAKARADGKKEADLDGDGDMEKVKESIFDLTNQWRVYKG
jgi:hypothetical protein